MQNSLDPIEGGDESTTVRDCGNRDPRPGLEAINRFLEPATQAEPDSGSSFQTHIVQQILIPRHHP
ncbi:MAG: hypothetical protein ACWGQW_25765, partial [bacterium]